MHLKIKEPCPANWDEMTSEKDGKFCAMCKKNVIDFTQKSKSDILIYLLENKGKNICAKMPSRELNFNYKDITNAKRTYDQSPFKSKVIQWSLISLLLASCNDNEHLPSIEQDPQPDERNQTLGKIIQVNDSTQKVKKTKISKINSNPIIECETKELGEVTWDGPISTIVPIETPENQENFTFIGALETFDLDILPEFPGGNNALNEFIVSNLNYPKNENEKEGIVYASFDVLEDGTITNIYIIKSLDKETFDKEVISVLNKMPKWIPAKKDNKPMKHKMTLPFRFELK